MGNLPAELEDKIMSRHKVDAEKAFADVAAGKKIESGPSFFQKAEVESETVEA